ncbi:hypothetical protein B0O99DRAFT_620114 [Bisporella sp. PMI_857]|nr:hypothetical protein B0O99DRAFT_620114 [Bisporella sp. PMI_857]
MCRQTCPRALISDKLLPQEKIFVNVSQQFEQYPLERFRFIHGTVTDLDHVKRSLQIDSASGNEKLTLSFHALVIATGASTQSPLLGLNRDADFLRSSWTAFRQALLSAKSIVIAGGGPSGIETAGELGEYLNGRAGFFASKMEQPKVRITVVTAGAKILPLLRTSIAEKAERYLAQVGVTVIKNARVESVAPEGAGVKDLASKAMITLNNGNTIEADIYIPAVGMTFNTGFVPKELLTADGRVETNSLTLRVDKAGQRIYGIGDASSCARPAVHNILSTVPILAANMKRDLLLAAGKEESAVGADRLFKEETREMQLVPIGKSKGVGAAMGWQLPSFLVWAIKGRDYWLWTTGNLWSGKQWAKES